MKLNQIDLNLFVIFDAIYRERNLTRAAEKLNVTQPAISNALARLRDALGDRLFVRTPNGMAPTPYAERMVEHVQSALQLINLGIHEGLQFDPATTTKTFRVSMNDMAEALFLPRLMAAMEVEAPGARLECYYVNRREVSRTLAAGTIDLACEIPLTQDRQLRQRPMMAEDYVCMVRPGHPVLDQAWTMDRYLGLDHLLVSSRQTGLGQVDFHLQQQLGKFRSIRLRVQHYLLAPTVLLRTDLAMSSPLGLAAQFDLPWLPLPFEMPPIRWHLHWHMSADQDQANIWLRDHIARVADDVVAEA